MTKTYPSPLAGYENAPPLPHDKADDGKSYVNPPADKPSTTYDRFADPLDNGRRGGFDVHIYYESSDESQTRYAHELWERIRREFPELRIYRIWDRPIGPHPLPMFEVNLFTPAQFGAFVPWLAVRRGPLSALVHPNTLVVGGGDGGDPARAKAEAELVDHTERALWLGAPRELNLVEFRRLVGLDA